MKKVVSVLSIVFITLVISTLYAPPPGDKCSKLRQQLDKAYAEIDYMRSWRPLPDKQIADMQTRIQNLEAQYKLNGCGTYSPP